ncbi:MAG: LAGLIDADG family homing endonuclease [Candidatus Bathycorpusculaceae bacterium]
MRVERKMRVIADLHIHGRYSRATSDRMRIEEIARFSKIKGLNLVGTGDFTHPKWLKDLQETLVQESNTGLYKVAKNPALPVYFMITTEVSTVFTFKNGIKKIHHVILTPNIETAIQINDRLAKYGNLTSDGRPTLNMDAPHLVEEVMEVSNQNMIFPAHAWTPWFSIFGAFSGFNSVEECYQDMTKHIYALETGLSCYDEETEVLTKSGWKKFSEIDYFDEICTLNPKTEEIEYQTPIQIYVYDYKGKMYRLKTKKVDLLVTPNHKLLYSPCDFRNPKAFTLKEARLLFGKAKRFKKDGVWKGKNEEYFTLPAVKMKHGNRYYTGFRIKREKKIPMKSWLKFFGIWLAGGWTNKGKRGDYNICLASKNANLLNEIEQLLKSWGYRTYRKEGMLRVRCYQLFHYLRKFGKSYDKHVPSEIKSLSSELLKIFLEYYLGGDGHVYGRSGKGLSATTISLRLRDDLQEIALKIGISAYYKIGRRKGTPISKHYKDNIYLQKSDAWVVCFTMLNRPIILPSQIKKYNQTESWVDYAGLVFCVSVPNKIIYIRRNGIPLWCGNSDPPMNWRLSKLDKFALVSNSDSHSFWPWRMGREANVFELKEPSYYEVVDAIRFKDKERFKFTIETDPAYGKYHWTGHRNCQVSYPAVEAIKIGNICPVCRKKLTKGVEQRVEELADRLPGFKPQNAIDFMHLLPLSEIIATVLGVDSPSTQQVWNIYNSFVEKFGDEYNVLIDAPEETLRAVNEKIAEAIIRVRKERIKVVPGYDGVYGRPIIFEEQIAQKPTSKRVQQLDLTDFI